MRPATALPLALALGPLASARTLRPRQDPMDSVAAGLIALARAAKTLPVAFVEDLPPTLTDRPGVVRQVVGYGPVALEAGKTAAAYYKVVDGICRDCTVLKGKAGIRIKGEAASPDAAGPKKVYIHHILNNEYTKPVRPFVSSCTTSTTEMPATKLLLRGGSKFIGTGDDQAGLYTFYTPQDIKLDAGYYVGNNYTFYMNSMLVNEEATPKDVFVTMEIEYTRGKAAGDTRDMLMMGGPCSDPMYVNVSTTGPTSTTSGNYFFQEDGYIVYAKGHLHAGGERMELFINNKLVCTSVAQYAQGDKGPITGIGTCPASIPVRRGDVLTMRSHYDGQKHQMRHDHGMMGGAPRPSPAAPSGGHSHGGHGAMGGTPMADKPDVMGMWSLAFSNAVLPSGQ